ncbi:MAG: substrate-binding domain-containing protein [Planctomycetaceae bacterium]|nr:substrate-binding domain-containing protein [Planctomycetaceae bacterium]
MRFLSFMIVAVLWTLVAGCGGTSTPEQATNTPNTPTTRGTIGYSALTLTNPFFQEISANMREAAADAGYELLEVSADSDVKKQADQIDDFIVRGVSAIILNPADSQSIGPAIQKANAAGIPVFTNDIAYAGDAGQVISHIATDNLQGGRLAGEAMLELVGETGGKIAILNFPQVESCQLRVKGFLEIVDAHNTSGRGGRIEIVATLDGGGARDKGHDAARDAVQSNPDLAAIFAINDPSALGAYAALEAAGKHDQIKLIGFDGQTIGKQAIRDGKIYCDPIQFPDQIGKRTIEIVLQYFRGDEVPKEVLIPTKLYRQTDAAADPSLK